MWSRVKRRFQRTHPRKFFRSAKTYTTPSRKRQALNITISQQSYVLLNPDGRCIDVPSPATIKQKWLDGLKLTSCLGEERIRERPLTVDDQIYLINPGLHKIIPLIDSVNHVDFDKLLQRDNTFQAYRKLFKTYRCSSLYTTFTPMFSLTPKDFIALTVQNQLESVSYAVGASGDLQSTAGWKDIIYKYDDIMEQKFKKNGMSDYHLIYSGNPFHKTSTLRLCSFADLVIGMAVVQYRIVFG